MARFSILSKLPGLAVMLLGELIFTLAVINIR